MIRRVFRDMGVVFPDMGVMDSRVSLYHVRLLFSFRKQLRAYENGVTVDSVAKPFNGPYEAHAMGARAVNVKLTPQQRRKNARAAAVARWAKRKLAA